VIDWQVTVWREGRREAIHTGTDEAEARRVLNEARKAGKFVELSTGDTAQPDDPRLAGCPIPRLVA
jgi:hypothetical protein